MQAGGHHSLDSYAVQKHIEDITESMEAARNRLSQVIEYQQAMGVVTEVPVSQVTMLSLYPDNPVHVQLLPLTSVAPLYTPLGCTYRTAFSRSGSWRIAVMLSERRKMMQLLATLLSYQNGCRLCNQRCNP